MTYSSTKLAAAVLAATLATFSVTAQTNSTGKPVDKMTALFGDPVVARGKGFEIKRSQLDVAVTGVRSAAAAQGHPIPPDYTDMEPKVLNQLIQIQLLLQKATDADKTTGRSNAEQRIALMLKRAGSQEIFNLQLKSVGISPEEMRNHMIEEAIAETVVERELKVSISDDDLKKYYDDHPSQFEQPEEVRVAQIFKATRDPSTGEPMTDAQKEAKHKELEALLKRVRGGENFSKLAMDFSDDTNAKKTGGELQPFPRDSMPNTPEFEAAAFSLNTNQISDVVTTQFGYHIIKLMEKTPAKKMALDTVSSDLREILKQRELIKRLPAYSEKLRTESKVDILDEKLKPSPMADPTSLGAPADKTSP